MNIRDLHYLVQVATHKHFGKAAEASFISQPTLSMQLKKLEEELGVLLIERTNKRVMLTEVGEEIAKQAKAILQQVKEMKEFAKTFHDPLGGKCTLGAFPTLAPYLLPRIVPAITEQCPELRLWLKEDKTESLTRELLDGSLDVALIALPIKEELLETLPLFEDPFVLAAPKTHPFAKRTTIKPSDLQGEQLLLLEEGHCLREQALEVCQLMGISEHQDFRATSLETLRQMVVAGMGITLVPNLAIDTNPLITYVPFASPAPSRIIGLAYRKSSHRTALFAHMADIIRQKTQPL